MRNHHDHLLQRRLPRSSATVSSPPFLFHYIDGGAYAEQTLRRNVDDFAAVALRQRVLRT